MLNKFALLIDYLMKFFFQYLVTFTLLLSYLFYNPTVLVAQHLKGDGITIHSPFYHSLSYTKKRTTDTIYLTNEITSLSLSIDLGDEFSKSFIISGRDTFEVQEDIHDPISSKSKFAQLIVFEKPIKSFLFVRGGTKGGVLFHLINSGIQPKSKSSGMRLKDDCGKPYTIDQSEWSAGLPSPNYSPTYSLVNHIIIHHTAGSNTNHDYTNVIRQIYLYHTEVRNYSDIAYNFLISHDGTIYEGREGEEEEEENVIGAHFCGKNTNTMGVSLLGNYETANPSNPMLKALESLMAWKLKKENLGPFEVSDHPIGSVNASPLGIIAGHRDGCPTECPGENVYTLIDQIKQNTLIAKENIETGIAPPQIVSIKSVGTGVVTFKVTGGAEGDYLWFTSENLEDSIKGATSSLYTTPILTETISYYVAIRSGNCISKLAKIEAEVNKDRFILYPNPASKSVTVLVGEAYLPTHLSIFDNVGKRLEHIDVKVGDKRILLDTSHFSSGVYTLTLSSGEKSINQKLIIQ